MFWVIVLFLGMVNGKLRFAEELSKISKNILSTTIKKNEHASVIEKPTMFSFPTATRVSYSSSTSTSAVDETTKPSSVEREEAYGKGLVSGIFSGIGNVIEKAVWFLRHFNQKRRDVTDKILDHLFVTKLEQEPDARR